MKIYLRNLAYLAGGFTLGWMSHVLISSPAEINPEHAPVQVNHAPEPELTVADRPLSPGDWFAEQLGLVRDLEDAGDWEAAISRLFEVSLQISGPAQQVQFEMVLADLVASYSRHLVSLNRLDRVDSLLEAITLSFPQMADYQLKLGKLRIQMGNSQAALPPLAQITNHHQFGQEARELMADIEDTPVVPISFESLPLISAGGQFVVEARLDDRLPILLLIDTGAALSIVDADTLRRAGYGLDGEKQYFSTAGGVVEAPVVTVDSLTLGHARVAHLAVGALTIDLPGNVAGLLGMNFLRHYEFRIDQGQGRLILDKR